MAQTATKVASPMRFYCTLHYNTTSTIDDESFGGKTGEDVERALPKKNIYSLCMRGNHVRWSDDSR